MFACVYLGAAASPAAKATAHLEVSASRALPMSLRYPGRVPRASLTQTLSTAWCGQRKATRRGGFTVAIVLSAVLHAAGRVVAVEAEPPELAAPVVEPGVVADVDAPGSARSTAG